MTNDAVENPFELFKIQRIGIRKSGGLVIAFWLGLMPLKMQAAQSMPAPDRDSFLKAVAEVETGGNTRAIGRHGERGLYQFTLATWRNYTSQPFNAAHDPSFAHEIAVQHFGWLRDRLTAEGHKPTAFQMAVAWNGGLNRALTGRFPRTTREYAGRVANLSEVYARSSFRKSAGPVTVVATNVGSTPRSAAAPADFRLGDVFVDPARDAPEVAPGAEVALDVAFNLSPSGVISSAQSKPDERRGFVFATVGK